MGLYHLVYFVVFSVYAPLLVWQMIIYPSYRRGLLERMGRVRRTESGKPVVWIHGVSVGEVKAAGTLIEALRKEYPDWELVLSSTTPTGHSLARELHPDLRVIYFPLDFGVFPRRALDRIRPSCVLLVELEIWPNFLQGAHKSGIPVAVVNGRMSGRSFRGYRMVRAVIPQFTLVDRFCVQDDTYRQRLLALDVHPERISVTGNMKYDTVASKRPTAQAADLRKWLSPDDRLVLVGGSTHGDEEEGLARIAERLPAAVGRPVRLVLAPRHPERSAEVRERVTALGLRCANWSSLRSPRPPLADGEIVLVDTIGQLENFYGACDIAFVGGSLVPRGGQNMLEPAALGKAVIFGPHVDNFRKDVDLLCLKDAAVQVQSWDHLESELVSLCASPDRRRELGERAVAVIGANKGSTERTLAVLRPLLDRLIPPARKTLGTAGSQRVG